MVSHVVSLEGIDKLEISDNQAEYIGLMSLHSWTWVALPPDHLDSIGKIKDLEKSIEPLRKKMVSLGERGPTSEQARWLYKQLQNGYLMKPYKTTTGEATTALFRGPFTPIFPARPENLMKTWLTPGTDLATVDEKTGLRDVSYQSAWQLGRRLAAGSLPTIPVSKQARDESNPNSIGQIEHLANDFARARGNGNASQGLYNQRNDRDSVDWANVLPWVIDVLSAEKIPLTEPESLPQESMRTFFVDPIWLECVVNGALSIGSQFQNEDVAINRELRNRINQYLRTPQDALDGRTAGLPKWGFVIRSSAISSLPDLRVEALLRSGDMSDQSGIFHLRRINEDVILCLTDRIPSDTSFTKLLLSQPDHQHGFAFGDTIDANQVSLTFKRLPTEPGVTLPPHEGEITKTWNRIREDGEPLPIFDWENRTVVMAEFAKQCMDILSISGSSEWEGGGCPSAIISSQLSQTVSRVEIGLPLDPALEQCLADPARNPWVTKDGFRQIYGADAI
ncbi:hypothetical protein ONZ43_g1237 [Nemania bipapillata]|uniref:Uncharacterized protein n=1 Tax=Nemania bipapillata TaxID=110536 RepID=A0ACC2J542_9PEZI|nr:hypothetical protein ONZ43_g1237 [Nemania bipapillata]